jgi:hypothetical protein
MKKALLPNQPTPTNNKTALHSRVLGVFRPAVKTQVEEIEKHLEMR